MIIQQLEEEESVLVVEEDILHMKNIEDIPILVVKRDSTRENFNREKL